MIALERIHDIFEGDTTRENENKEEKKIMFEKAGKILRKKLMSILNFCREFLARYFEKEEKSESNQII